MATVLFYEKPGCINNTQQKKLLRQAGHIVIEKDLLQTPWCRDQLIEFFSAMPVEEWFNSSAPQVKSGEVSPRSCSVEQAVELMIVNPIFIHSLLIKTDHYLVIYFH